MAQSAKKMDTFIWEGTNQKGVRTKGEATGANMALVKANLRKQGINPLKVKKKPKALFGGGKKTQKITGKDIAIFMRQLAVMMSAGVPLVQSFEIVGKGHDNPSMREVIMGIKANVEGGGTLADALSKYPRQFDDLSCNLVYAGEQAGILEDLLGKIATYKEKTEAIKGKIKKALFYPTAVVIVAFIITAILMIFVIPMFADLFRGFGADLPALTQMVMNISDAFVAYWWAIFGGIGGLGYGFVYIHRRSKPLRDFLDKVSLKVPIIGNILNKAAISRFARTFSTMFAAGVPLVDAMVSVSGAVGNVVYGDAVMRMRDEVSTGTSLTASMERENVFPNMVIQMVSIGEESGSLDAMLSKVADFYEAEVDDAVDGLASLLEPLIMAVLGGLIGTLVVAMYLPIFKMGAVV